MVRGSEDAQRGRRGHLQGCGHSKKQEEEAEGGHEGKLKSIKGRNNKRKPA